MKKSRFTEAQIMSVLRQAQGGMPVPELCREHGISCEMFYKWQAKYGSMDASMMSQMKALEGENRRLKRMFADPSMQADLLREALEKSDAASSTPGVSRKGGGYEGGQHRAGVRALGINETCFRYSPRRDEENEMIADLLKGLTNVPRLGASACASCTYAT